MSTQFPSDNTRLASAADSAPDPPLDPQFERAVRRVVRRMIRRREADAAAARIWKLAESVIRHSSTTRYDRPRLVARVTRRITRQLAAQARSENRSLPRGMIAPR